MLASDWSIVNTWPHFCVPGDHVPGGEAVVECPGDVGGAPQVLAAAVHHVEAVLAQPQQESIFVKEKGSKIGFRTFIKAIFF